MSYFRSIPLQSLITTDLFGEMFLFELSKKVFLSSRPSPSVLASGQIRQSSKPSLWKPSGKTWLSEICLFPNCINCEATWTDIMENQLLPPPSLYLEFHRTDFVLLVPAKAMDGLFLGHLLNLQGRAAYGETAQEKQYILVYFPLSSFIQLLHNNNNNTLGIQLRGTVPVWQGQGREYQKQTNKTNKQNPPPTEGSDEPKCNSKREKHRQEIHKRT